jgi:hypothetical protein
MLGANPSIAFLTTGWSACSASFRYIRFATEIVAAPTGWKPTDSGHGADASDSGSSRGIKIRAGGSSK